MLRPNNGKQQKPPERTCEHLKGKLKKQAEKQAFYRRNPDKKWGDR